jgi:hypothetical protein
MQRQKYRDGRREQGLEEGVEGDCHAYPIYAQTARFPAEIFGRSPMRPWIWI